MEERVFRPERMQLLATMMVCTLPLATRTHAPPMLLTTGRAKAGPVALDLVALRDARSGAPPSELAARREKYAFFEKQCSEVAPGLFLGSDAVARSRDTLRRAGLTHLVDCVGLL